MTAKTPEKIAYTAVATATEGGREGRAGSSDGKLDVSLTAPTEMGGSGAGTNPEQLFAAGYAACFNSALSLAAKKAGKSADGAQVRANVGIGPEGESFALSVELEVAIPGADAQTAQELADAAHQLCPYSKATRGNVPVKVTGVSSLD